MYSRRGRCWRVVGSRSSRVHETARRQFFLNALRERPDPHLIVEDPGVPAGVKQPISEAHANAAAAAGGQGAECHPLIRRRIVLLDVAQGHASGAFAAFDDDLAVKHKRRRRNVRPRLVDQARHRSPRVDRRIVPPDVALEDREIVLACLPADRVNEPVERDAADVVAGRARSPASSSLLPYYSDPATTIPWHRCVFGSAPPKK